MPANQYGGWPVPYFSSALLRTARLGLGQHEVIFSEHRLADIERSFSLTLYGFTFLEQRFQQTIDRL
jgi:hypothetical protein